MSGISYPGCRYALPRAVRLLPLRGAGIIGFTFNPDFERPHFWVLNVIFRRTHVKTVALLNVFNDDFE